MSILTGWKLIVVSLILGVGIMAVITVGVLWAESRVIARILLWPSYLIVRLIPPHNIGTEEDPFYEGTPLDLLAVMIGLILNAIFYGSVVYLVLKVTKSFRSSARRDQDN